MLTVSAYHLFGVARFPSFAAAGSDRSRDSQVWADASGYLGLAVRTDGGTGGLVAAWHSDAGLKNTGDVAVSANKAYLLEASFDGSQISLRVGGAAATPVAAGNVGSLAGALRLGRGSASSVYLPGTIGTFLACSEYLSPPDVASVRGYLSSKYGVPA